jgi:hypothetical protein
VTPYRPRLLALCTNALSASHRYAVVLSTSESAAGGNFAWLYAAYPKALTWLATSTLGPWMLESPQDNVGLLRVDLVGVNASRSGSVKSSR